MRDERSIVIEEPMQIGWDYLEGLGEVEDWLAHGVLCSTK
jgi:hypothetical protein